MKSPAAVRAFFETVLQRMRHFKVDVIALDSKAAAYMYYKNQEYHDLYDFLSCRHAKRDATRGASHLLFYQKHPSQLHEANDFDCCFMAILSWESQSDPES